MNTLIDYIKTGIVFLIGGVIILYLGKFLVAFDYIRPKDAGLFMVVVIASIVGMYFVWKFFSTIERFSTGLMFISMIIGGGVLISMFGMDGVIYAAIFGAFCKTLELIGFYKAIYRGIGNVLGFGFAMVVKPKTRKLPKYL